MRTPQTLILLLAALAVLSRPAPGESIILTVDAGRFARHHLPVILPVPKELARAKHFSMERTEDREPVPVQLLPGKPRRLAFMLGRPLKAGQKRNYVLTGQGRAPDMPPAPAVTLHDDGRRLHVRLGKKTVLAYNHAVVPSPDPKTPYYQRSGHLHPVFTPSGVVVTDDFSPDHAHQHGVMFAWTKTQFLGKPAEFWNQKLLLGTVVHAGFVAKQAGPVAATFTAKLRHIAMKVPGGPKTALNETWTVRVYNRPGAFLFDLESAQQCATGKPLEILKYHYGAMAIRGRRNWINKGDFLTSEGKTRKDGNHSRPNWVDIHGPVGKSSAGATLFGHPGNFRFPQPVRLHPSMPYFCFAPMVLGPFRIEPGKPYVSKFRFYVHDGTLDPKHAEAIWNDYANPVRVSITVPVK